MLKPQYIDSALLEYYEKKKEYDTTRMASLLDVTEATYRSKKSGKTSFTVTEMFVIQKELEIPDGELLKIFNP